MSGQRKHIEVVAAIIKKVIQYWLLSVVMVT